MIFQNSACSKSIPRVRIWRVGVLLSYRPFILVWKRLKKISILNICKTCSFWVFRSSIWEKLVALLQASDARSKIPFLIDGMRNVLFSLATFSNNMINSPMQAVMPNNLLTQNPGLTEEEIRLASRGLSAAIPCLKLFAYPTRTLNEREFGIYDTLADMVSVVTVNFQLRLFSKHFSTWFLNHLSHKRGDSTVVLLKWISIMFYGNSLIRKKELPRRPSWAYLGGIQASDVS